MTTARPISDVAVLVARTVIKWGNSLAVRIPLAVARQMGVEQGAEIELRVEGRRLIVEKVDQLPPFSEDGLRRALRKVRRELVDFGAPRGRELV